MYRVPSSISRSVTHPSRGISSYARNAIQAPIIPRYRHDVIIPINISRPTGGVMTPVSTQPTPGSIVIPASMATPFPLPQFTQPLAPHIPISVTSPYPLPHYTQPIIPSPVSSPITGMPYPLPHYTQPIIPSPVSSPITGLPTGYHHIPTGGDVPPSSSSPLWPWLLGTAIGVGVGLGVVSLQDKHTGEQTIISSHMLPLEAGMGHESALTEVMTSSEQVSTLETTIVPVMQKVFRTLFSWVGLCGTFVLLCFVTVIRAKLFPGDSCSSSSSSSTTINTSTGIVYLPSLDFESSSTCSPAPLPTKSASIPPLDLETARVILDNTAKTYVEQLIAYYEAMQETTDRNSYSSRLQKDMAYYEQMQKDMQ